MRRTVVLVALAVAFVVGCAHPVGPARTFGAYEGKARTTVSSARSNVETVRLAVDALARGNSFGPYTAVVVSDAEDALGGLQGTFGSIQPPDRRADALRREVDDLLGDALDGVSAARIAVRRSERPDTAALVESASALAQWLAAHP